jgi:CBS domain-containing protein
MLRLKDIMTKDVVALSPTMTLREAMELFVTRHVSGAPVVSRGRVVGVLSTTDILAFQAATAQVQAEREVEIDPVDAVFAEADEAIAGFYTAVPDEDTEAIPEILSELEERQWDVLEEHMVAEVMTQVVFSLSPTALVTEAALYMREAEVHRILVMDDDVLVGIVTTTDLAAVVADRRLVTTRYVFDRPPRR